MKTLEQFKEIWLRLTVDDYAGKGKAHIQLRNGTTLNAVKQVMKSFGIARNSRDTELMKNINDDIESGYIKKFTYYDTYLLTTKGCNELYKSLTYK